MAQSQIPDKLKTARNFALSLYWCMTTPYYLEEGSFQWTQMIIPYIYDNVIDILVLWLDASIIISKFLISIFLRNTEL